MLIDTRASARTSDPTGDVQVSIQDNQGTVSFGGSGPVAAFLYKRIAWTDVNFTLLAGIGITDGAWLLFWLYCTPDGALARFYGERTDGASTVNEIVSGTCDQTLGEWNMPVEAPAHHLRGIPISCGFDVDTPAWDAPLSLHSSEVGVASIDGSAATALVFATVDCRTDCGSGSWSELHSVLWQPSSNQVAFAIWYLVGNTSGQGVDATNSLLLPAAGWTDILHPKATWSFGR
jgi:hypothetical protein